MTPGGTNKNGQKLLRKSSARSDSHPFATIWVMQCPKGHQYGCNSCDAHERRRTRCSPNAKLGERIP